MKVNYLKIYLLTKSLTYELCSNLMFWNWVHSHTYWGFQPCQGRSGFYIFLMWYASSQPNNICKEIMIPIPNPTIVYHSLEVGHEHKFKETHEIY